MKGSVEGSLLTHCFKGYYRLVGATMVAKQTAGALEGLIRDILNFGGVRNAKPGLQTTAGHFRHATGRDYPSALRKHFGRQEMTEIIAELRRVLPTLNREVFRVIQPRLLAKIAAEMGVIFQARPIRGSTGHSLRGFYVHDRALLKRPLIGLNTANHPVSVAAAFWHEVGHHLTGRMLDIQRKEVSFSFGANYQDHLEDQREIAADIVMALAAYPRSAARRLFGDPEKIRQKEDADEFISKVVPHVRSVTGFDFEKRFPASENLLYLAGIIHLAKLRSTLLSEYDI